MRETVYEIQPKSQGTPYKDWATTGKEDKVSFSLSKSKSWYLFWMNMK